MSVYKIAVILPVYCPESWQVDMTLHAVELLFRCTGVPFDLVVADADDGRICERICERIRYVFGSYDAEHHVHAIEYPAPTGNISREVNAGIELAEKKLGATHVVHTGNDVFVRPGWLEALLAPWNQLNDVGASTLLSYELARCFPQGPGRRIEEGVYGPFMMFEARERFDDEVFPRVFNDTDLVCRLYERGKKSYRAFEPMIYHLNRQTNSANTADEQRYFWEAKARFDERYKSSTNPTILALKAGTIL